MKTENIYEKYIIPTIEVSDKGDTLSFISPSTFFGFYSLGAKNFELVCAKLNEAKQRGVVIRLIIHVHDQFSAKAGEGLLQFLDDGKEIKNLKRSSSTYFILLQKAEGQNSLFYKFISDLKKAEKDNRADSSRHKFNYLDGITSLPFLSVEQEGPDFNPELTPEKARNKEEDFLFFWESSTELAKPVVDKFNLEKIKIKNLIAINVTGYIIIFCIGLAMGLYLFMKDPQSSFEHTAAISLLISFFIGVLSSLVAAFLTKKYFTHYF